MSSRITRESLGFQVSLFGKPWTSLEDGEPTQTAISEKLD